MRHPPASDETPFTIGRGTALVLAPGEDAPTARAAGVLADDLAAILGRRPDVRTGEPGPDPCLFVASASNPRAAPALRRLSVDAPAVAGRWESYLFARRGPCAVVCGADPQATLRGVYGFGRDVLGVDPFGRWHGLRPAPRARLALCGLDRVVPEPAFRFRGWFLNHDTLIRWNLNRKPAFDFDKRYGRLKGQPDLYGTFGPELAGIIAETCLRADMNTLIPLSYLDVLDPEERATADVTAAYGLHISFHHQEPLGANLAHWERFWRRRRRPAPEMSFHARPAAFREWWAAYAGAWAQYERVLWVVGHRGPGDRPFWISDRRCPATDAARGALISKAMELQVGLIRAACGARPASWCATLWQEGSPLHHAGHLRFPAGTIVVMADHGAKQTMREDFYRVARQKALRYGVYYHACYGPGGPLSTQGNSPDRMWHAMEQVIRKGDTALALLNVGAIRPYYPGLACWSEVTTRPAGFQPERFLQGWCEARFGARRAEEVVAAYHAYFHGCIAPWYKGYDGARGFWDGVLSSEIVNICRMIRHGDVDAAYPAAVNSTFPDAWTYLHFQRNKAAAALDGWEALCPRLRRLAGELRGAPRELLIDNLLVQSEIMRGLFAALRDAARAGIAVREGHPAEAARRLGAAARATRRALAVAVGLGNRGFFRGWFTGERLTYLDPRILEGLQRSLEGRSAPAERRWLARKLAMPKRDT